MTRNGLDTTPNPAETNWTLSTSNWTPNTQTNNNNNNCSNLPSKFIVPFLSKSYILNRKNWIFQPHLQKEKKKTAKIKRKKEKKKKNEDLIICWTTEMENSRFPAAKALWSHHHHPISSKTQTKRKKIKTLRERERETLSWGAEMLPVWSESTRSNHSRRIAVFSIS